MTNQTADRHVISQLISRIGETDQEFLTASTPMLALQRARLRLELVRFSHQKNEKVYFLTEAAALLEMALMDSEEVQQNALLSASLAEIYLEFYQTTAEDRYLIIVNQILKPLSHLDRVDVLLGLSRVSAAKKHTALTKHWLGRLLKLGQVNPSDVLNYREFDHFQHENWLTQLLKPTLH